MRSKRIKRSNEKYGNPRKKVLEQHFCSLGSFIELTAIPDLDSKIRFSNRKRSDTGGWLAPLPDYCECLMLKKVLVPIAEGSEDLEAVTIIDVLRRAGADVTVASVQNLQITGSRGINLVADKLIGECMDGHFDMIALPGGLPGAENLRDSNELKELLLSQRQENRFYAAVCAAPAMVFQTHGLLKERKATCYPAFAEMLEDRSAAESRVVVDGTCVTGQGPGSALEFSLKLVELLLGQEKADEIAGNMLVR